MNRTGGAVALEEPADFDEVGTFDDLLVSTGPESQLSLRCPSCGVLPVPQRGTTLSDLTNAGLEHLHDVHLETLAVALGVSAADLSSLKAAPRLNRADVYGLEQFWSLVALLGPQGAAGDVEALTRGLAGLTAESIRAFDQQLMTAVEALDTPDHARQEVFDLDHPLPDLPPVPGVSFLYARVAAVAAGPDSYSSVLAEPGKLAGGWPLRAAQLVLGAAPAALQRVTGRSGSTLRADPRAGREFADDLLGHDDGSTAGTGRSWR